MAVTQPCPACAETEDLSGSKAGEEIRLTCGRCGHAWLRGVSPCATCAGTDVVGRPQSMTRTPRGNQLAIIGTRSIALCQSCDADVLQASLRRNQPVPEGYVAAYRHPRDHAGEGQAPSRARTPAAPAPVPVTTPPSKPRTGAGRRPRRTRTAAVPAAPAAPTDPTVRQAVATVMEAREDLDATTVLLFSTHVGTTTRLSHLDNMAGASRLASWVEASWPDPTSVRGRMARATLRAMVDEWADRDWLNTDIAIGMRADTD